MTTILDLSGQDSTKSLETPSSVTSASPLGGESFSTEHRSSCDVEDQYETPGSTPPRLVDSVSPFPIAVIGMAFKFPQGAEDDTTFWQMLADKKCAASTFPQDRFDIDAFWNENSMQQNIINPREGHFLKDPLGTFDAGFFSMTPHEAGSTDPQQRILLETAYHAFENAGLSLENVAGSKTSVHIGGFTSDFSQMLLKDAQQVPKYAAVGSAGSIIANRLSWFFDLRGESLYLDTACSSSLIALSLGCQQLYSGRATMALVGASSIILSPEFNIALSNMNFLSPGGRCRSFDKDGDGYGRGEGFATLILKPAHQAITDGDPIRAIIRAVGTNQDGHTSGGITQPSKDMQAALICETYRSAGLSLEHTLFFEAHGTGTAIGDPTEAGAIGETFRKYRSPQDPIYVGAVKSNIGHLEGTSGLAGVVKTILALEKGIIPPNTNFEHLNPRIDAHALNLKFPEECVPWPKCKVRRASVNSFGFGGSNAHVVIEAAEDFLKKSESSSRNKMSKTIDSDSSIKLVRNFELPFGRQQHGAHLYSESPGFPTAVSVKGTTRALLDLYGSTTWPRVVVLSARDEAGIERQATSVLDYLRNHPRREDADFLGNFLYTLNVRRSALDWKSYAVLSDTALWSPDPIFSKCVRLLQTSSSRKIGVLFTGQGAQWALMGRELLSWSIFRSSLNQTQNILRSMGCEWNLVDEILEDGHNSRLNTPEFSQTVSTALQIALTDVLTQLKADISVVIGHSSGEIAAAYCAGFLSQSSAIRIAYLRGILASKLVNEPGDAHGMASVGLGAKEVDRQLTKLQSGSVDGFDASTITISCINSPRNVTVSGPLSSLEQVIRHFKEQGVFARRLKVDLGYHSKQMCQIASEYRERIGPLPIGKTTSHVRMISTVEPGSVTHELVCTPDYWVRNMVSPVRFAEALELCCRNKSEDSITPKLDLSHKKEAAATGWIEIGPHSALRGPLRENYEEAGSADVTFYVSLLVRGEPADQTLLHAIGKLYCSNFRVNLAKAVPVPPAQPPRTLSDLPSYAFNHSTVYWDEPFRAKTYRLTRKHPRHELLGAPVMDWNPLDARWRLILKKEDMPWIQDHQVYGEMIYPAAGSLVMAIEAIKQMPTKYDVVGYEIKDARFPTPIVIDDSNEGTVVEISLIPASTSAAGEETEYRFRIFMSRADNSWQEVSQGAVAIDTRRTQQTVDHGAEDGYIRLSAQRQYAEAVETCDVHIDKDKMYTSIAENTGLRYGPAFQPLSDIHHSSDGRAVGKIHSAMHTGRLHPMTWTIHPSTLDGIFQLSYTGLAQGWTVPMQTLLPSFLSRLWVSAEGVGHEDSEPEIANSYASMISKRTAASYCTVLDPVLSDIRLKVEHLEAIEVPSREFTPQDHDVGRRLCRRLDWRPDFSTMGQTEITDYCHNHRRNDHEPIEWFNDLKFMMLSFAARTFEVMEQLGLKVSESQEKYCLWLRARVEEFVGDDRTVLEDLLDQTRLQGLQLKFLNDSKRGNLSASIGKRLPEMLTGTIDPLEFIFKDEALINDFYRELNDNGKAFDMLDAYLDTVVHQDPGLRFLEIGAGTGATTDRVLATIANPAVGYRFASYMFTDVSPVFVSKAMERYSDVRNLNSKVLNIERDPLSQGHEGSYDILIAANVLHATEDIDSTLSNVRKLLKPGGKLVMMEMTTPTKIQSGFVFGLLPGWWLGSEEYRRNNGAIMTIDTWDQILQQNEFTGCDHVFEDWDSSDCQGWSIIITSVPKKALSESGNSSFGSKVTVVLEESSERQMRTAESLKVSLQDTASVIDIVALSDKCLAGDPGNVHAVLLTGLDRSLLRDIDPRDFQAFQKVFMNSKSLTIVSSMNSDPGSSPDWAMMDGLARVLRNEDQTKPVLTVTLEQETSEKPETAALQIEKIIRRAIQYTLLDIETNDSEWKEFGTHLCVNRLMKADMIDDHIYEKSTQSVRPREFDTGNQALKLAIRAPGILDSIEWVEDAVAYQPLLTDEIEIKVSAIGVNFKECLTLLGRVDTDLFGSEVTGYIHRIGSSVENLRVGDRVVACSKHTYQTFVRTKECLAVRIPSKLSFREAASIPTAFLTAYVSLIKTARLQKGETILIHAAAGGTGQAAIQLAKNIGAEIFVTVGSEDKKRLVMQTYEIPEDHIFYSRDASFADGIKRMTNARGVDVILNSLSGKLLVASWECIAAFGRFVEIGRKDIDTRGQLPMYPFIRNATFSGIDLAAYLLDESLLSETGQVLQRLFDELESGKIRPPYPITPYPVSEAAQAFRLLQSGKSAGKIVLEVSGHDIVPVRESDSGYRLASNATYVVVGGLGGIGRQVSFWLAKRGAKHILLISRSSPKVDSQAFKMVCELREQHVNVQHIACDVADSERLQNALNQVAGKIPAIRGCIQAAMVLNDRPFGSMTHEEWDGTIRPKVQGSWNLHQFLPSGLEFFVMLSSVTGIVGNPGQSNYAAGNTFQDALARMRVSQGQKATSLDLGIILGEGFVAENQDIHDRLIRYNVLDVISQDELFALLDKFCNPTTSYASGVDSQVITGIRIPDTLRKQGVEIPAVFQRSMFRSMHQISTAEKGPVSVDNSAPNAVIALKHVETPQEAETIVAEILKDKVCKFLGLDPTERSIEDRMESFGVDSLVGLELRNWIKRELHADLAVFEILGDTKIVDMGRTVVRKSDLCPRF